MLAAAGSSTGALGAAATAAAALRGVLALSPALLRCGGRAQPLGTAATPPLEELLQQQDQQQQQLEAEQDKQYTDRLKLTAVGGRGGSGCQSFFRSSGRGKKVMPDGGGGGDGGSIVLRATNGMKSLSGVQQLYKAPPGEHGGANRQRGRAGRDTVVLVPLGTQVSRLLVPGEEAPSAAAGAAAAAAVGPGGGMAGAVTGAEQAQQQQEEEELPEWLRQWQQPWVGAKQYASGAESDSDAEEGEEERGKAGRGAGVAAGPSPAAEQRARQQVLLADLTQPGQEVVVAAGGRGGRGNANMRRAHIGSSSREADADSSSGEGGGSGGRAGFGERVRLLLELKMLADVGLVGLPNVGKSTLLRALSAATPRVGDYAFTTLAPQLGVVELADGERLVLADIPGLVEGAHLNRGLGHHFLRHIERTQAIAFVVDLTRGLPGVEGPRPWEQLAAVQEELERYSPALSRLPALVVANKVDAVARPAATLSALRRHTLLPVVPLSARERQGLPPLLAALRRLVGGQEQQG